MSKKKSMFYPYIPNSIPKVKAEMLKEIGIKNINELFDYIPKFLLFKGQMNLPEPLISEYSLKRHVEKILSKNRTCEENINFLGGGCWQHYVPAICDEINQRSEFLTAYAGTSYEDHGRWQALFEYASMIGELVGMEVVSVPTYDWSQAASTSIRMASRITKRNEVLIPKTISPDRLLVIQNYCKPDISIKLVEYNSRSGYLDLVDLRSKTSSKTAAIYFENPSYLGFIEVQGKEISNIIHKQGALSVVGVDPSSLGVLLPPSNYSADIVCGELQPLGIHMQYGGGLSGFIATRDEERFVMECPLRLFGLTHTVVEGEYGFGDVAFERTSFAKREKGKEFVGTMSALWGITAGVYLALMGPQGMQELGRTIMQRSQYAAKVISEIKGIKAPVFQSPYFKEFVVDFNGTGRTVEEINKALIKQGIFGGKDLLCEFPELGNTALYCITEVHIKEDIDKLASALKKIVE